MEIMLQFPVTGTGKNMRGISLLPRDYCKHRLFKWNEKKFLQYTECSLGLTAVCGIYPRKKSRQTTEEC